MESRATLKALASTLIPDNTRGLASPAHVRTILEAIIDSSHNLVDDGEIERFMGLTTADVPFANVSTQLAELDAAVGDAETWAFSIKLLLNANATNDCRLLLSVPAVGNFGVTVGQTEEAEIGTFNALTQTIELATGDEVITIDGGFTTNAAGNLTIAIENGSGTATQNVLSGSSLRAWKK